MINIKEVKSKLQVSSDGIGFVVMQPYLSGRVDNHQEPFKWLEDERAGQLERIHNTLQISLMNLHGCEKSHFTIFPEYALPGFDAIEVIDSFLLEDSWPCGTAVVGGLDGLTKDEYARLCGMDGVSFCKCNDPKDVLNGQWINCCIVWEKASTPEGFLINKFVQAKMRRSTTEELIKEKDMYCGKGVFVFEGALTEGPAFRFLNIICYDWMGVMEDEVGISAVLESLDSLWSEGSDPKTLDLVLLIQCNPKPNFPPFLEKAFHFFDKNRFLFVSRDDAVIAMLNTAKSENPACCKGGPFGSSSLVFSPSAPYDDRSNPPTYAVNTRALRNSDNLLTCKDTLFREAGECVHSFGLMHPRYVNRATQHSKLPIVRAVVSPLSSDSSDPRTANEPIAASVKWINDQLDELTPPDSEVAEINSILSQSFVLFEKSLRYEEDAYLRTSISYATSRESEEDVRENCDLWDTDEIRVLRTWSAVVSLISCKSAVSLGQAKSHGVFRIGNHIVEIVIVVGTTHSNNIKWADRRFLSSKKHKRFIISRDLADSPSTTLDRERAVYEVPEDTIKCTFHGLNGVLSAADKDEFLSRVAECIGAT